MQLSNNRRSQKTLKDENWVTLVHLSPLSTDVSYRVSSTALFPHVIFINSNREGRSILIETMQEILKIKGRRNINSYMQEHI